MASELVQRKSTASRGGGSFGDAGGGYQPGSNQPQQFTTRKLDATAAASGLEQSSASVLDASVAPKPERAAAGRRLMNNFSQQKLRAWQPVLTPKWIVSVFIGFGLLFVTLGIILLLASRRIIECSVRYDDPIKACSDILLCTNYVDLIIDKENCVGLTSNKIEAPVFLYYELRNYHQNHRRYVRSRNDDQLRGVVFTNPSDLSTCDPIVTDPGDRVLSPCGLVAWSVFNDTFVLLDSSSNVISVDDRASVIAWTTDVEHRFRNPSPESVPAVVHQWLNPEIFPEQVENGHFIVWMRTAALPTFRKFYGQIRQSIYLPITIRVANRYPVAAFNGEKRVVLSTTSWLGGRNNFLGIAYIVISAWCLVFGIFFIFKNYENPSCFISCATERQWPITPDDNIPAAAPPSSSNEPLFPGQIIGGRTTGDLSKDITEEAWKEIPNCDFYIEQPARCTPNSPFSPCRYCKAKAMKFVGTPECPGVESFPHYLQEQYQWNMVPHKTTSKMSRSYLCVVQARIGGLPQQAQPWEGSGKQNRVSIILMIFSIVLCDYQSSSFLW